MSILITGATGFIGGRLYKALSNKGKEVKVISRNSNNNFSQLFVCDISKEKLPSNILNGVSTVFHLAGYAHDLSDPKGKEDLYKRVNVEATRNLAKICVHRGVKKFIFVSSTKAGSPNITNQLPDMSFEKPQGVYGRTKRQAEEELLKIAKNTVMNVSIVRPSLVYGPNVKGNLSSMLNGIKKGWFPPLPDAGNSRSMIHVDDLIQALLLVEKNMSVFGEIYIATDSRHYSSKEIYASLCQASGKKLPKWEIPIFFFKILSKINSSMKYKIEKLLGDEYYSSQKLESLGFRPLFTLKQINETLF